MATAEEIRQRARERREERRRFNPELELGNDAPSILRDQERGERRQRIRAKIRSGPDDEEAVVNDDGSVSTPSEEDREHQQIKEDTQAVSGWARTFRDMLATGIRELHPNQPAIDFLVQTTLATAGYTAGTVKGAADVIRDKIEKNKHDLQYRWPEIEEEVKRDLEMDLPENAPLDPNYLAVLESFAEDEEEIDRLADGETFLKNQQEVVNAPVFHYTPISPSGMQIEDTLGKGFAQFEEWGDQVGDAVFEATGSPMLATVSETSVAGVPYYLPLFFNRTARTIESGAKRRARSRRRKETEQETETLRPEMEDAGVIANEGRMSPKEVISRVDNFPTEEMLLNRGFRDTQEVIDAYKGTSQKRNVVLEMAEDGKLRIVEGDVEVFARSKVPNSADRPMNVEVVTERGATTEYNTQAAQKMDRVFEEAEAASQAKNKGAFRSFIESLYQHTFDHAGPQKARLLKDAGQVGRDAIREYESTAGATPRGQLKWQGWEDRIYSGLRMDDINTLDRVIMNERIRQIDRIHGIGKKKHPGGATAVEATENLKKIRNDIGSAKYKQLRNRAETYFDAARHVLDELYVEGLITKSTRDTLKQNRYEPRRLIEQLDKSETFQVPGQGSITVSDSGIRPLDKGTLRSLETNSRALMAEYVIRMENKIMQNRSVESLGRVADVEGVDYIQRPEVTKRNKRGFAEKIKHPRTGKEVPVKPPQGMIRLNHWNKGEQQPVFVSADMAQVWTSNTMLMNPRTANAFRVLSGSFAVRPLATGYNPGFAAVNLPRDIMHAFLATEQYSVNPAKFAFQIGRDMRAVRRDAWNKDGQYLQAIDEGMGMNFLTHQGREIFPEGLAGSRTTGETAAAHRVGTRKWKQALSKINEFSEIWVRLGIRHRAMKNGLSSREATYEARRYLDFAQGGMTAKAIDTAVPYTNATLQAFRTVGRAAKEHPGRFSAKIANLNLMGAGIMYAGWMSNPEAMRDIPEEVRRTNFILPMPEMFSYTDPRTGEYKHRYIAIRKDNTVIPFTAPLEMLMEKYLYDMDPDKELTGEIWDLTKESLPIVPGEFGVPTQNALDSYLNNWDSYFGEEIWKGPEVSPENEFYTLPNQPTPRIWRELGQTFDMSPERAERAFRKVAPRNDYLDALLYGLEKNLDGMTLEEKQRAAGEWFIKSPILNRLFKETHPMANRQTAIERGMEETGDRRITVNRTVDEHFHMMKRGEQTRADFESWASQLEGPEKRRAYNRWVLNKKLDQALTHGGKLPIPVNSKSWWLALSNMDGAARAQTFYETWRALDSSERRRMERVGRGLTEVGKSFWNEEFAKEFNRQRDHRGEDQY